MDDEDKPKSFEERLREIAEEVARGFQGVDIEEMARSYGLDSDRARGFIDEAGAWLRGQAEGFNMPAPPTPTPRWEDPLRGAGPDPLDMPTGEQGRALAALESGRWTVEPGTSALASHGEGPGPSDALGLVRELRVRDWIDADGDVTVVGRHALTRWLDASD